MVCSGLIAGFYRSLESGPRTATAPASASDIDFADRCIAVCQDVASMYPDDLVPMLGGAEQSAFSMARRTAQNIEDRIKTLAHR